MYIQKKEDKIRCEIILSKVQKRKKKKRGVGFRVEFVTKRELL